MTWTQAESYVIIGRSLEMMQAIIDNIPTYDAF